MAIRSSGSSNKSSANLAIIIGVGVVVLIILVAVIARSHSSQANSAAILGTDPNAAYVLQKAKECKGNFHALSQADQDKLVGLYGGYGAASTISRVYYESTQ